MGQCSFFFRCFLLRVEKMLILNVPMHKIINIKRSRLHKNTATASPITLTTMSLTLYSEVSKQKCLERICETL